MTPAESAFRAHLHDTPFLDGVDREKWGLHGEVTSIVWPKVVLWVGAAPKAGRPDRYYLAFDLAGYPNQAPTACPWDINSDTRLPDDRWPRGPRFVSKVFNPGWNKTALYAPCDRVAMNGHETWKTIHVADWWQPSHTIVNYLNFVHRLLHLEDYTNA